MTEMDSSPLSSSSFTLLRDSVSFFVGLGARPAFVGFDSDGMDGAGGDVADLLLIFIFGLDPPGVRTDGVVGVGVEGLDDEFVPPFVLRLNFNLNGAPLILAVILVGRALYRM